MKRYVTILAGMLMVIVGTTVVSLMLFARPDSIDEVNLERIIAIPARLKQRADCGELLNFETFDEEPAPEVLAMLGYMPEGIHSLKEATAFRGCVRTRIAVFAGEETAGSAYNHLLTLLSAVPRSAMTSEGNYLGADEYFIHSPQQFPVELAFSHPLLYLDASQESLELPTFVSGELAGQFSTVVARKCNAVITVFALSLDAADSSTTAIAISDQELLTFTEQVLERTGRAVCDTPVGGDL